MGHVGLPTALGFAELGWNVLGVDRDTARIAQLKKGLCPFYERGMSELLSRHLLSGRFTPTADIDVAIQASSVLFICVGTPQRESGEADLNEVEALARRIAHNLNEFKLIVEKSTVPAITGQLVRRTVARSLSSGGNRSRGTLPQTELFDVASNPEFLQEGKAIEGFFHPDRIVCGVGSERSRGMLAELYAPLGHEVLFTDVTTAELIKHAANAFLATKISFINMVADVCEAVGADVAQVASGLGADRRIGPEFLKAGIGFGGYCLPKDLRAFIHLAEENGVDCSLLRATEQVNNSRATRLLKKLRQTLWTMEGKVIAVLGLAFKGGTDDIREAPALKIIAALKKEGAVLRLYDPKAAENAKQVLPEEPGRVTYCNDPYQAASGAHALLVLTDWSEFAELDLRRLNQLMEVPILFDGRGICDAKAARAAGFEYLCMGGSASRVDGEFLLATPIPRLEFDRSSNTGPEQPEQQDREAA
jgi:UDPglucose 6-dehydrogenase